MTRSPVRFTQAEVTKLIKAARGAGFECVTVEVLPGAQGLRATYSAGSQGRTMEPVEPSALQAWQRARANQEAKFAVRKPRSLEPTDLSNREREAIKMLYDRRGRAVSFEETRGAGLATQSSLARRGFVTLNKTRDGSSSWRISDAGVTFVEAGGLKPASNHRDVI